MIVYIDMDDTLVEYTKAHAEAREAVPAQPFPQSQLGFFANLALKPEAFKSYRHLVNCGITVKFLTAPSVYNPLSYMEKRISIEKHFGFEACYDLIICHDKSLLRGDVLVDDKTNSHKQSEFQGELIHFGSEQYKDWPSVVTRILALHKELAIKNAPGIPSNIEPRDPWLALWCHHKGYDFETFRDCDNGSDLSDDALDRIWALVDEIHCYGTHAFREKYKAFTLFP